MNKVLFIFISLSIAIVTFIGLIFYTDYAKKNPQAKISFNSLNILHKSKPMTNEEKKQKAVVNQMKGSEIEFARHQCDGPRECPKPDQEKIEAAMQAIRAAAKSPNLELFPIGGVNPRGIMYYCTSDNRCWGVENETNKIVATLNNKQSQKE